MQVRLTLYIVKYINIVHKIGHSVSRIIRNALHNIKICFPAVSNFTYLYSAHILELPTTVRFAFSIRLKSCLNGFPMPTRQASLCIDVPT